MKSKPPTTYIEQLAKITSRGCAVGNDDFALKWLQRVNYYRFSAYFLPFKIAGTFQNVSFEQVVKIYEFDSCLRKILFAAIEKIEISFKSKLAYYFAHKFGALAYTNVDSFGPKHNHERFMGNFEREIRNASTSLVVKHHKEKYNGEFPIWVAVELFTFGMASKFYSDLQIQDQKIFARDFYSTVPKAMVSCLRCCVDLRNICAHYGRIYFRIFGAIPSLRNLPQGRERSLLAQLLAAKALYPEPENWQRDVVFEIKNLLGEYKDALNLEHLGFPVNWEEIL